jgi:hypothetical protein
VAAPANRAANTDALLLRLGLPADATVRIALTEVQMRYFMDARITVLSLDGRSSPLVLEYIDRRTGLPDFDLYLLAARPDYVILGQWCSDFGWIHWVIPIYLPDNLMCRWQQLAFAPQPPAAFDWLGHTVTVVRRGMVHIDWQ